ncbi:sigma-54-dependent Fis family transcriptional regulator [candidate division KSB1 bacterium]|nr:sigma-54-dependent Fis family transcriptional regulator [candidate division KSB1 bacterium]
MGTSDLPNQLEKILIADDEPSVLLALKTLLGEAYHLYTVESGEQAWRILQEEDIAVALLDLNLPEPDGLALLARIREHEMGVEVIMITGDVSITKAVEAMRLGAYDYLPKPVETERLEQMLAKAAEKHRLWISNRAMQRQLDELTRYEELLGQSEAMREVYRLIEAVAKSDTTVLITGASGTGKELVARAIHQRSNRRDQAFVAMNCSALPADILENELFGHEKGAFTGALTEKPGCFELADRGTLFFDEIGEMPFELQAKLLRALEERKFRRLGGRKEISVDVRIISATNRDVREAVREKTLREDLFYRLAVVEVELPPLRERLGDLALLVENFIKHYSEKSGKKITGIARAAFEILLRHTWPGNVRELRNVIERAVILCSGRQITPADLPKHLVKQESSNELSISIGTTVEEAERQLILRTLEAHNNNKTHAAETLGISLKTLHNKLERFRQ